MFHAEQQGHAPKNRARIRGVSRFVRVITSAGAVPRLSLVMLASSCIVSLRRRGPDHLRIRDATPPLVFDRPRRPYRRRKHFN